jgi:hypothetical protein
MLCESLDVGDLSFQHIPVSTRSCGCESLNERSDLTFGQQDAGNREEEINRIKAIGDWIRDDLTRLFPHLVRAGRHNGAQYVFLLIKSNIVCLTTAKLNITRTGISMQR